MGEERCMPALYSIGQAREIADGEAGVVKKTLSDPPHTDGRFLAYSPNYANDIGKVSLASTEGLWSLTVV